MLQTGNKTNDAAVESKTINEVTQRANYCIYLSKSQVENLVDFFKFQFIDMIRNDECIYNIDYIADMMQIFMKLCRCEREIKGEQHEDYLKP